MTGRGPFAPSAVGKASAVELEKQLIVRVVFADYRPWDLRRLVRDGGTPWLLRNSPRDPYRFGVTFMTGGGHQAFPLARVALPYRRFCLRRLLA